MTQQFKQLIYCNDNSSFNTTNRTDLISGGAFTSYVHLSQLGVQAPPGTKFYLNGGIQPVIVGFTGLFELDLTLGGSITSIRFDPVSLANINANDSSILIIDMAYMGG